MLPGILTDVGSSTLEQSCSVRTEKHRHSGRANSKSTNPASGDITCSNDSFDALLLRQEETTVPSIAKPPTEASIDAQHEANPRRGAAEFSASVISSQVAVNAAMQDGVDLKMVPGTTVALPAPTAVSFPAPNGATHVVWSESVATTATPGIVDGTRSPTWTAGAQSSATTADSDVDKAPWVQGPYVGEVRTAEAQDAQLSRPQAAGRESIFESQVELVKDTGSLPQRIEPGLSYDTAKVPTVDVPDSVIGKHPRSLPTADGPTAPAGGLWVPRTLDQPPKADRPITRTTGPERTEVLEAFDQATAHAESHASAGTTDSIGGTQLARAVLTQFETAAPASSAGIRLSLDPPGIGSIRIHVLSTPQGVSGRLQVHDDAVRQALQSQVESLRQVLAQSGIRLGNLDVQSDGNRADPQSRGSAPAEVPSRTPKRGQKTDSESNVPSTVGGIDVVV
jgi:hypothetical protein